MLVERLEEYFKREERVRVRDYFYVTEVAKCPRQIFYSARGFPRPPLDGQTARKLAVGDAAHQRIVQALYGMGIVVAAEASIPPNPLFHGRADVIVSLDGRNYVVEIKTVHPYNFEQMVAAPRRDHYLQLQLYLHYFDIPQGVILAENKANQELREFVVSRDDAEIARVLSTFEELRRIIFLEGRLPSLPDKSDWEYDQCRYCPFVEFCAQELAVLPGAEPVAKPRTSSARESAEDDEPLGLFDALDLDP